MRPIQAATERFDIEGCVAVVTGASSGLGEQFARVLDGAGARVVVAARRVERLEQLAGELDDAMAVECDVAVDDDCRTLIERTVKRYGRVDILVNNAGVSSPAPVDQEDAAAFRHIIDVNLVGAYSMCRYAGRQMVAQSAGSIVNIASVFGLVGVGRMPQASYAASKAGLVNLTRELAAQWSRQGVRVNAIAPGFFPTEMTAELFASDKGEAWLSRTTPMGRGGYVHELDGALLFLASEASSYVTGAVLPVDGGWTAV